MKNKNVRKCYIEDSAGGDHRNMLQSMDYIPREAREIIRGEKKESKLEINIRRITANNSKMK